MSMAVHLDNEELDYLKDDLLQTQLIDPVFVMNELVCFKFGDNEKDPGNLCCTNIALLKTAEALDLKLSLHQVKQSDHMLRIEK